MRIRLRRSTRAALLSASFLTTIPLLLSTTLQEAIAGAVLPSGGHYVVGQGSIGNSAGALTVDQSSRTGIIDWNSFSVGKNATVAIDNGTGATLNRVTGGNLSRIAGDLSASGTAYLIDPEGVIVSATGKVVTGGGFVASSQMPASTDEQTGRVVDAGSIRSGGNVRLSGSDASVSGEIAVTRGGRIWLTSTGTTAVTGSLDAQKADGRGGRIETSGAKLAITGVIDAGHGGQWIVDPDNLTVNAAAAGTIDMSLNGGTSVTLMTTATGTSGPGRQSSGPGDIIVDASLNWSGNANLTLDAYHSVLIKSGKSISNTGAGNLTLAADTAALDAGTVSFASGSSVDFAASTGDVTIYYHPVLYKHATDYSSDVALQPGSSLAAYMTVDTAADLQALQTNLKGIYALNANIDAASIANFAPIGSGSSNTNATRFDGTLYGRGYTISNLTIESNARYIGLFGALGTTANVSDLGLVGAKIVGKVGGLAVGALAGKNEGTIETVSVSGSVKGNGDYVGGLVGNNGGTGVIDYSYTATTVVDNDTSGLFIDVGGLAGINYHDVTNSYATRSVTELAGTTSDIGGLVGWNDGGSIMSSHAIGAVTANASGDFDDVGGLVGRSGYLGTSAISASYASGDVSADGQYASVGGLVGALTATGSISNSQASGNTIGDGQYAFVGGLVGAVTNKKGAISDSQASGDVTGGPDSYDGGLVGSVVKKGSVTDSTASGTVTGGTGSCTGHLIGYPNRAQPGCE